MHVQILFLFCQPWLVNIFCNHWFIMLLQLKYLLIVAVVHIPASYRPENSTGGLKMNTMCTGSISILSALTCQHFCICWFIMLLWPKYLSTVLSGAYFVVFIMILHPKHLWIDGHVMVVYILIRATCVEGIIAINCWPPYITYKLIMLSVLH